ncbi:sigma-54-dependent transcriptional regulator [Parasphingopyxis marina]|uniref:DNA-binding transcriptional regulator NtrC n=1 Tax=Parasphingopyxis marina TaxID=2761622 RepID=A0A842I121_9SPHN|nr:sigma-54 dependent transcriptional regulator [Parasphingopyxis marina]MBC2778359.1 sigma-54-dependent Fis family transcriptional regulator [Parasphingopyxis marina]
MPEERARALLLIDDEPAQGRLIAAIAARAGWRSLRAESGSDAMLLLGSEETDTIDAVLLDLWSPRSDGVELIGLLSAQYPTLPILVITAQSKVSIAVDAMRAGATDFLAKPIAPDRLIRALNAATHAQQHRGELRPLTEKVAQTLPFDEIVGSSPEFRAALAIAAKAARSRVPVLLEGEPGVGKEVFARAVHAASPRSKRPLFSLHCGATPPNLIESELFGHEKGAFTGAFERHVGKLAEAEGATLFIDEITAIPFDVQAKLAKALETGTIRAIGARRTIDFDVRLIAGANSDLLEQVTAGNFREDLYYRLNIVGLTIPPLRKRAGDIPPLARHLLTRIASQPGMKALGVTDDALSLLMRYDWPGNVRQLQDTLFRAAIGCEGAALTSADFPEIADAIRLIQGRPGETSNMIHAFADGPGVALYEADGNLRPLADIEADVIRLAIGHYRGRMTEVARRLGIGRSTLYRKLAELGIDSAA